MSGAHRQAALKVLSGTEQPATLADIKWVLTFPTNLSEEQQMYWRNLAAMAGLVEDGRDDEVRHCMLTIRLSLDFFSGTLLGSCLADGWLKTRFSAHALCLSSIVTAIPFTPLVRHFLRCPLDQGVALCPESLAGCLAFQDRLPWKRGDTYLVSVWNGTA